MCKLMSVSGAKPNFSQLGMVMATQLETAKVSKLEHIQYQMFPARTMDHMTPDTLVLYNVVFCD